MKKAKEDRQFRGVFGRCRRAVIDRTIFHACQRSGTTYRSTSDDLKKKGHDSRKKTQGKAITQYQNSVLKYHPMRSGQLWLI